MGTLDRYILRSVATPLTLALCVAAMLLLIEHMLRLFDFVLAEQGPVDVVWRMLANLVPHYLSLALPLGAFLGTLLAFRNLSLSSELDAMNSSGVSFGRLLRPVLGLLFLLAVFDFFLVGYIKPYARYEYDKIRFDVTSGAFGIKIPQGEFVDITDDVTIRLGKVDAVAKEAQDIFVEMRDEKGGRTVITAAKGGISTNTEISYVLLKLANGRQILIDDDGRRLRTLDFESLDLEVSLPEIAVFRARGIDADEATFSEIVRLLRSSDAKSSPLWRPYRAQMHWTILHPLTFLALPILAVAMGVTGRRRASNLKPVIGVAILIIYHEMLEEWGLVNAALGTMSPYVSMWGLFAVFVLLSLWLYRNSIDQVRTARADASREQETVRISAPADGETAPVLRTGAAE